MRPQPTERLSPYVNMPGFRGHAAQEELNRVLCKAKDRSEGTLSGSSVDFNLQGQVKVSHPDNSSLLILLAHYQPGSQFEKTYSN